MKDAVVFANQVDDSRHGIIDGDQGEIVGVLAGEIVDL